MSYSILACKNEHYICLECVKDKTIRKCPICDINIKKQKPKRRYQAEKISKVLLEFQQISVESTKAQFKKEIGTFVESKLDCFECPVCFETIKAPLKIMSCTNDHYTCSDCLKSCSIKNCPICRESFEKQEPKRRFLSENILSFLQKHVHK